MKHKKYNYAVAVPNIRIRYYNMLTALVIQRLRSHRFLYVKMYVEFFTYMAVLFIIYTFICFVMMKVYNICGLKCVCVDSFKFYFMTLCVLLIAVCTSWFKINKTRMVFYNQHSMIFRDTKTDIRNCLF